MIEEASLRAALDAEFAGEPEMRLTVDTVLTAGRRSRARRQAAAVALSTITVGAMVAAAFVITGGAAAPPSHDIPTIATSPSDPVPSRSGPVRRPPNRGTDLLDAIAAKGGGGMPALIDSRVSAHLPGALLAERTITTTTWGNDRIPWEREPFATEWRVSYGSDYTQEGQLTVWPRFSPVPQRDPEVHCASVDNAVRCDVRERSDGTTVVAQESFQQGTFRWSRAVWHLRDNRFTVGVIEDVRAMNLAEARRQWAWTVNQLVALATDPKLVMPRPAVWPKPVDSDPADMQLPG